MFACSIQTLTVCSVNCKCPYQLTKLPSCLQLGTLIKNVALHARSLWGL